ncbi:MAG: hypothetical protein AAB402_05000 [Patescibacteria group bacterium]
MDDRGSDQELEPEDEVEELHLGETAPRRDASMLLAGDDPISRVKPRTMGLRTFSELRHTPTERSLGHKLTFGRRR